MGSWKAAAPVWPIADPVNPQIAIVLQLAPLAAPAAAAVPVADALFAAGQVVGAAAAEGRLGADYVLHWLANNTEPEERKAIFRRVMDPAVRFQVPIVAGELGGWWVQVTRRLVWVTQETPEEGRLLEPLFGLEAGGERPVPLCAYENILVAARLTSQPVEWAFMARVWTADVRQPADRPWRDIAGAIHSHGVPIITIDPASTQLEIACQVVLKAYWHGYISGDEPGLANAIALAYPKQVARVRTHGGAPSMTAAAATLLEGLIRPGFDPALGAEASRRYVTRKASIAVMNHRKREAIDRQPWTLLGISERRYYKLVPSYAPMNGGRYQVDASVIARMRNHLDARDTAREIRVVAREVLREHGFSEAAARKWLQRHRPEEAVKAWPRGKARGGEC